MDTDFIGNTYPNQRKLGRINTLAYFYPPLVSEKCFIKWTSESEEKIKCLRDKQTGQGPLL